MRAYVIILNWNGWKDTIECLESVLRLDYPDFRIVVCDNASTDNSMENIKSWARGELLAGSANPQLQDLTVPPYHKPVSFQELTRNESESSRTSRNSQIILIQTGANLGYAGGNNVGMYYALLDAECQYCWLLNNDTVVKPDALTALVNQMRQQPRAGLCGSLNLSYSNPTEVQALGGKEYHRWTGRVKTLQPITIENINARPAKLDYINGASMLATRRFLEQVGLMDESYFLYFEELDWAMRAKDRFELAYSASSIIYHKEGATLGSSPDRMKRSLLSEQYLSRNRTLFTRRFLPWALPSVVATVLMASAYRLLRGDGPRAKAMVSSMIQGLFGKNAPSRSSCATK